MIRLVRQTADHPFAVLTVIALAVAVWLRVAPALGEFPTGDGGLFWVMANELRANGFVPPEATSFNDADIPWMYPPIGLYLAALAGGGLEWFRILPALWALATIPALWLLARALTNERAALVASVAYGLSAAAYVGLVAGGGVTRGPGMVFALLTMWAVVRGHVARAGLLGGLVLLSHPLAAFYAGLGSAVLWATRERSPRMLLAPLITAAFGALWFGPMILRHGPDALFAGAASRSIDLLENAIALLAQSLNPPNLAFTIGAVGVVVAGLRRRWDLLAWFAVTTVGAAVVDRWVVIPLSVLAGLAVDSAMERLPRMRAVAFLAVASVAAVLGVALADAPTVVPAEQRAIMDWARDQTPGDAEFALIGYSFDSGTVDWFPPLSHRRNVTTWQGTEWVADGSSRAAAEEVLACRDADMRPRRRLRRPPARMLWRARQPADRGADPRIPGPHPMMRVRRLGQPIAGGLTIAGLAYIASSGWESPLTRRPFPTTGRCSTRGGFGSPGRAACTTSRGAPTRHMSTRPCSPNCWRPSPSCPGRSSLQVGRQRRSAVCSGCACPGCSPFLASSTTSSEGTSTSFWRRWWCSASGTREPTRSASSPR